MKKRITIRLDDDILVWFKDQCATDYGEGYQTLINDVLRSHVNLKSGKGYHDVEEYYKTDEDFEEESDSDGWRHMKRSYSKDQQLGKKGGKK